ncbi:MAG: polyisoprenoid-binding protein, partial [Chloroflexi bacterium]
MKHSKSILRPAALILFSLVILAAVIQFAPTVQAPAAKVGALTTRVAAITAAPPPTAPAPAPAVET